jgi:two-component sensor histidine kinase
LKEKDNGEVVISSQRTEETLIVTVRDNGGGLPEGKVGDGLGTQIVRTLVQGELGGSIDWHTLNGEGTEVTISVPMQFLHEKDFTAAVPSV